MFKTQENVLEVRVISNGKGKWL